MYNKNTECGNLRIESSILKDLDAELQDENLLLKEILSKKNKVIIQA